jgi:hypothetical protein
MVSKVQHKTRECHPQLIYVLLEHKTITEWLTPLNFKATQRDVFEQQTEGTGQWLLASHEFQTWLSGESRTLWCYGMREMPFINSPF